MSLAGGDLTTLPMAQSYLDSPPSATVLVPLITRSSRVILSYLNRSMIYPRAVTQQFNGQGTRALVLPVWPVIGSTLTSLVISGVTVPIAPQISNTATSPNVGFGYRFQPWSGAPPGDVAVVELVGYYYLNGNQNIVVSYNAGYQVTGEVPTEVNYTPLQPYGTWATDQGVTYTNSGVALVAVNNSSPGPGEYVVPNPETSLTYNYIFNSADVAAGLLINYGYIPSDLEQACLDYIGERASYRKRIGMRSQGLAGQETFSYDVMSSIPPYIRAMLQPYVTVISPNIGADT